MDVDEYNFEDFEYEPLDINEKHIEEINNEHREINNSNSEKVYNYNEFTKNKIKSNSNITKKESVKNINHVYVGFNTENFEYCTQEIPEANTDNKHLYMKTKGNNQIIETSQIKKVTDVDVSQNHAEFQEKLNHNIVKNFKDIVVIDTKYHTDSKSNTEDCPSISGIISSINNNSRFMSKYNESLGKYPKLSGVKGNNSNVISRMQIAENKYSEVKFELDNFLKENIKLNNITKFSIEDMSDKSNTIDEISKQNMELMKFLDKLNSIVNLVVESSKIPIKNPNFSKKSINVRNNYNSNNVLNDNKLLDVYKKEHLRFENRFNNISDPSYEAKLDDNLNDLNSSISFYEQENKKLKNSLKQSEVKFDRQFKNNITISNAELKKINLEYENIKKLNENVLEKLQKNKAQMIDNENRVKQLNEWHLKLETIARDMYGINEFDDVREEEKSEMKIKEKKQNLRKKMDILEKVEISNKKKYEAEITRNEKTILNLEKNKTETMNILKEKSINAYKYNSKVKGICEEVVNSNENSNTGNEDYLNVKVKSHYSDENQVENIKQTTPSKNKIIDKDTDDVACAINDKISNKQSITDINSNVGKVINTKSIDSIKETKADNINRSTEEIEKISKENILQVYNVIGVKFRPNFKFGNNTNITITNCENENGFIYPYNTNQVEKELASSETNLKTSNMGTVKNKNDEATEIKQNLLLNEIVPISDSVQQDNDNIFNSRRRKNNEKESNHHNYNDNSSISNINKSAIINLNNNSTPEKSIINKKTNVPLFLQDFHNKNDDVANVSILNNSVTHNNQSKRHKEIHEKKQISIFEDPFKDDNNFLYEKEKKVISSKNIKNYNDNILMNKEPNLEKRKRNDFENLFKDDYHENNKEHQSTPSAVFIKNNMNIEKNKKSDNPIIVKENQKMETIKKNKNILDELEELVI